jgi:hypothetical protein
MEWPQEDSVTIGGAYYRGIDRYSVAKSRFALEGTCKKIKLQGIVTY